MHDDARFLRLARSISEGMDVNWREAESGLDDVRERSVAECLRIVENIARFHRSQKSMGSSGSTSHGLPDDALPALRRWGHLEILEKLDEGVFGEVYRAWETTLDREVALKLLRASAQGVPGAGAYAPHVLQEGRHLARVRHPNVVTVYGAEEIDGRVGLWMEYIRGLTLEDLLHEQGTFGAREAALVGVDLCRALTAVHRAGLLHRDVKAKNAMREEGGRIVLMDFGAGADLRPEVGDWVRTPAGTPVYLAPEVFLGRPATVQSDLYSMGVLLYHLVSASFPVQGGSLEEMRQAHERHRVKLLREVRPDLPESFLQAIERALAFDPQARFESAGQLEHALATSLVGPAEAAHP